VQQANADQDVELFNTLLSGVDDRWVEAQGELVQQSGLFDRLAFDLIWQPPDTAVTQADVENGPVNITVNPELNAAELTFPQDYVVAVGNGVTQTIQLQHTAVYRLGTQRWLYAPPEDEFWGEDETVSGAMLRLTYPARDSELAQRLAFDLDDKLEEMCRTLADLNCFTDYRLRVRWASDPQSLLDAAQPGHALRSGSQLTLPTPTLVGLPVDEAGYQALYRGYANQLVGAAIAGLTDYECCSHLAYFQALLDYQLDELGLRPLTLEQVDYERVVRENIAFEDLDDGWRSPVNLLSREDGWLVVTAVDFIHQQLPNDSIASLQREMDLNPLFTNWLGAITAGSTEFNRYSLDSRWQLFAFEQVQVGQGPPPLPLPAQDIYLLCTLQEEEAVSELYQYKLSESEWSQHPLDISALSLNPLPDDEAFLLFKSGVEEVHTSLWQDGSERFLFENGTITFGQFEPTGRYLQAYGLNELVINRVDWPTCAAGDCALEPLGGYPVWSPQGTDFLMLPAETLGQEPFVVNGRTILFDPSLNASEWSIYRGNGQPPTTSLNSLTYVGTGYAPFWLDESTFGYIWQIPLSSDSSRHELVLMSTTDETPQPILSQSELQLALPEENSFTVPHMRYVMPHPHQPGLLFIVAMGSDRQVFIFSYDVQADDLQFLLDTGLGDEHSLGFSPDGRFLIVTGPEEDQQLFSNQRSDIYLYDLDTGQIQTFAGTNSGFAPANTYDWSADGQWLVIAQENQTMALAAPAYGYLQLIPHDLGNCSNAVWMNQ
jgi:WD40 repeat protein